MLRDWTAAFVLGDKADSARENMAKWRRLPRKKLREIDSTGIIKKQIAKQLNKQADQLTADDLIEIEELSLMGENVSDTTYIADLISLDSFAITFV